MGLPHRIGIHHHRRHVPYLVQYSRPQGEIRQCADLLRARFRAATASCDMDDGSVDIYVRIYSAGPT
jgi:hypothetical protein